MKPFLLILATAFLTMQQTRWEPDEKWLKAPRRVSRPAAGFITQKATAIAIGRAVIDERYGQEFRKSHEPLDAKWLHDVWVVYGYLPVGMTGGTVSVQLSAKKWVDSEHLRRAVSKR